MTANMKAALLTMSPAQLKFLQTTLFYFVAVDGSYEIN